MNPTPEATTEAVADWLGRHARPLDAHAPQARADDLRPLFRLPGSSHMSGHLMGADDRLGRGRQFPAVGAAQWGVCGDADGQATGAGHAVQ